VVERWPVAKLLGLMLFFIGIGMVIGMLVADNIVIVIVAAVFLMCGYYMFCR
jgi:hypothetical protein